MKKVSIIIPLYNNEKYIKECIESLISQTYENIEIIIVDDGSTDKSVEVCEKFKDERIRLIKQINFGAPSARNEGIKQSSGDFIMFLDSDDYLYDKYTLEKILKKFDEEKYDLYIGEVQEVNQEGKFIKLKNVLNNKIHEKSEQFFLGDPVPAGKIFKSSIIKKFNIYFDNVRIGQDLNFYLKYLGVCENVKKSDDVVASYRVLNNSISRTYGIKILDITESINKVEKFYKANDIYEKNTKMLNAVKFIHFYNQFVKYVYIKEKHLRKFIKYYLKCQIKNIKINYKDYSNETTKYIKNIAKKIMLKKSMLYYYYKKNK